MLARTIRSVLNTPAMAKKAKAIGTSMQQENGLARAIELIESVVAKHELSGKKISLTG
jgi:UDP:flavonoid glycosyltransferase YjiC (YdhE family)